MLPRGFNEGEKVSYQCLWRPEETLIQISLGIGTQQSLGDIFRVRRNLLQGLEIRHVAPRFDLPDIDVSLFQNIGNQDTTGTNKTFLRPTLLLAATKMPPSPAMLTLLTGTSSSGTSSWVQAFSPKSHIRTTPDWSEEMISP